MHEPEKFKDGLYGHRVKIEGLFSSVKGSFGGYVRSLDNGPRTRSLLKLIARIVHILLLVSRTYGVDLNAFTAAEDDDAP